MPRMGSRETEPEDVAAWLSRLEEYEPLPEEKELFTSYLFAELGYNEAQIEALWSARQEVEMPLAEHGIRAVPFHFSWGTDIRYFVQGLPGAWGWERVQEIREEEEW